MVGDVWRDWSSAMAQDFVSGVYTCATSAETVRIDRRVHRRRDPPAALRRLLIEGRDDVLRALRCQAKTGRPATGWRRHTRMQGMSVFSSIQ